MMEDYGFLAIILIWGGLIYLFLSGSGAVAGVSGSSLFSSVIGNFSASGTTTSQNQGIQGITGFFDKNGNFEASVFHFNQAISISDIEVSGSLIFAASDHGLFTSKDSGLNWYNFSDVEHKINSDTRVYRILFNPLKPGEVFVSVFSSNKGIIYKSEDKFFSLEKLFEVDNEAAYDFGTDGENLYLALSNGRLILYSLANDTSRVISNLGSPITEMKFFPNTGVIYAIFKSGGFWVSNNYGQSFQRMIFLDSYRGANTIHNFVVSDLSSSLIYAATDYGLIRSFDGGAAWQVFKSLPSETQAISAVGFKSGTGEIFAASTNGKIYKSADSLNWQIIDTGLNRTISIIKPIGDKIIIGTKK